MIQQFTQIDYTAMFVDGKLPLLTAAYLTDEALSLDMPRLLHSHPNQLELFYAYSGHGEYLLDGKHYQISAGDLIIFNAGVLHGEEPFASRTLCSYCYGMTDVFFKTLPPNHLIAPNVSPVLHCGKWAPHISRIMEMICTAEAHQHASFLCTSLAMAVLYFAYQGAHTHTATDEGQVDLLAQRIKQYLDAHYSDDITLEKISEALHINTYYLSHVFKKATGYSPKQYILCRRIGEIQTLLMSTDLPIAEIGSQLGYLNPCHFNTIFKKYVGMTPGEYRRSFRTGHESPYV